MPLRPVTILFLFLPALSLASPDSAACANDNFEIDTNFAAGNIGDCNFSAAATVDITIRREDSQVTIEQPWFAFRVSSQQARELTIRLHFPEAHARYWPKLSSDGRSWRRADADRVTVSDSNTEMQLVVNVHDAPLWVAAQELLTDAWYEAWLAELVQHPDVLIAEVGRSVQGRPLMLAKTADRADAIVLLGRQHPAEIPGALAMRRFVDTLLADTELARRFRERFTLLVIPLMNPDGVAEGHWRHNAGKTDLNRDWGRFTQPETRAVATLLAGVVNRGIRPRAMLDFHATKHTDSLMFYTQTADEEKNPPGFAARWLGAVAEILPDFDFQHAPRPSQTNPNTKGYFHRRYGIPAYTYELGDEADRELIHTTTPVLAEEFMRALLCSGNSSGQA